MHATKQKIDTQGRIEAMAKTTTTAKHRPTVNGLQSPTRTGADGRTTNTSNIGRAPASDTKEVIIVDGYYFMTEKHL